MMSLCALECPNCMKKKTNMLNTNLAMFAVQCIVHDMCLCTNDTCTRKYTTLFFIELYYRHWYRHNDDTDTSMIKTKMVCNEKHYISLWYNTVIKKLTGTVLQVLLMNRSLPDDWLYDRVMLQLLGTPRTVRRTWELTQCSLMSVSSGFEGKHAGMATKGPLLHILTILMAKTKQRFT